MGLPLQENTTADLGAVSDARFSFNTKIAILSFYNRKYPYYIEVLLVLIEYFQLASQIIFLVSETTLKDLTLSEIPLLKGVAFLCKVFNPFCFVMLEDNENRLVFVICLFITLCYTILKHILFSYIAGKSLYQIQNSHFILNVWGWMFKLQGRVLYFVFSSFWVRTIRVFSGEEKEVYGIGSTAIIIIASFMIMIEYVNSLYVLIRYCYVLPTKNFMTEKDNYAQIITISQKLLLQILQISLSSNPSLNAWIIPAICLLMDFIRILHHFIKLPLYNIKALFYQGSLLMIITSLSICWLSHIILKSVINYEVQEFIWIAWGILSLLMVKASRFYLLKFICNIVTTVKNYPSQLLVHKVSLIKQIRKLTRPADKYNDKTEYLYLVRQTINTNMKSILNVNNEFSSEDTVFDINCKESANRIFLHYLETLLVKFPKNDDIRLYLAYFYAKKMRLYGKAIKIITELEKSYSNVVSLNTSLLEFEIQNILTSRYKNSETKINLSLYVQSHSYYVKVKQQISKQIESQTQLYQEMLNESPRLVHIVDWSQRIHFCQQEAERKIKQMFEIIPEYFVEPLAFLTLYHLMVNHSHSETVKYRKLYLRKYERYKKYFNSQNLQEENAYQSNNFFILISGERNDYGTILLCTKSVADVYGSDPRFLIGKNVTQLVTAPLQSYVSSTFRAGKDNQNQFNQVLHSFGGHHEGHMVEVESYNNVYPFLNGSFCLATIVRQVVTTRDCLLINDNGDIEAATKNIRAKLRLKSFEQHASKTTVNIKVLSKELSRAIKAFNHVSLLKKSKANEDSNMRLLSSPIMRAFEKSRMRYKEGVNRDIEEETEDTSLEEAQTLCSIYAGEGKEILLSCPSNGEAYLYHCKVLNMFPENYHKKIIALQAVDKEEDENKHRAIKLKKRELTNRDAEENKNEDFNFFSSENAEQLGFEGSPQVIPGLLSKSDRFPKTNRLEMSENILSEKDDKEMPLSPLGSEKMHTEASNLISALQSPKYNKALTSETPLLNVQRQRTEISKPTLLIENNMKKERAKRNLIVPQKAEGSVADSRVSRVAKQIKISNAFQAAVAVKSYPKCSVPLCFLFYIVLASVLGIQFHVKLTWEDNLNALKVKKDILSNALLRNFYLVSIPSSFATFQAAETGKIDFSPIFLTTPDLMSVLEKNMEALIKTNNVMLRDTNSLSEEMRQTLFQKDIRVFDYCTNCSQQTFIKLNNFQATTAASEYALNKIALAKSDINESLKGISLFYQNCMNDLMVKNGEISEIFSASLTSLREEILTFVNLSLIISIGLLVLNLVSMTLNIWNHYKIETRNLLAVTKLSSVGVADVLDKVKHFKHMMETQTSFEKSLLDSDDLDPSNKNVATATKGKKDFSKIPNKSGLSKKYYLHIAKLVCLTVALSGLAFWSTATVHTFIENIYEKQNQLYFVSLIRSKATLAIFSTHDMITNGPNRQVANMPFLTFLSNIVKDMNDLRSKIPEVFPLTTLEEGSEIKSILVGDGCQPLNFIFTFFCGLAQSQGVSTGFIHLLTYYEKYVAEFYEKYSRFNETEQLLYRPDTRDYGTFTAVCLTLTTGQSFFLSDKIDSIYEEMLNASKSQRNIIFSISTVTITLLMTVFWFFALKDLKEVENRFKKLLQAFPPELILSNFFLKSFLIKTSNGAFDFVRNVT